MFYKKKLFRIKFFFKYFSLTIFELFIICILYKNEFVLKIHCNNEFLTFKIIAVTCFYIQNYCSNEYFQYSAISTIN